MPPFISKQGGGGIAKGPVEFGDPVTAKLRYEIIPPGGFEEVLYDNFSTNTLDDVTRYPNGRGSHTITAAGHAVSSAANAVLVAGPAMDEKRVTGKQTSTGTASEGGLLIAVTPDGWKLVFQYVYVNVVSPTGTKTQLTGMGAATTWNRITKQGSLITREGFTADPRLGATPTVKTTYTLPAIEATRFAGSLPAGIFNQVISTASGVDDFTLDKVLGEQRRLVADVDHPASGVVSTLVASEKALVAVAPSVLPSARKFVGTQEIMLPANYAAFAVAPTPDRVTLTSVPAGRVIGISFLGEWMEDLVGNSVYAALFVNGQQIRRARPNSTIDVQQAVILGTLGYKKLLKTCPYGLLTHNTNEASADATLGVAGAELPFPTATGVEDVNNRVAGVPCFVFNSPSGDVVVEVRYKINAGRRIVAVNRTLVAWVV